MIVGTKGIINMDIKEKPHAVQESGGHLATTSLRKPSMVRLRHFCNSNTRSMMMVHNEDSSAPSFSSSKMIESSGETT